MTMKTFSRAALLGAVLLAGCASLRSVVSDVWSYGNWPPDRKPGTYAFDRLPSQAANPEQAERAEDAARPALLKAGFVEAAPGDPPDVLVQVGARQTRYDRLPWDDPLWWHGGYGPWRYGPWVGPAWTFPPYYDTVFDREVAVLIRDRASGRPLYETRASSSAGSALDRETAQAMFEAALMDFPNVGLNPRRVEVVPDS
jgi:hypothetical protein